MNKMYNNIAFIKNFNNISNKITLSLTKMDFDYFKVLTTQMNNLITYSKYLHQIKKGLIRHKTQEKND